VRPPADEVFRSSVSARQHVLLLPVHPIVLILMRISFVPYYVVSARFLLYLYKVAIPEYVKKTVESMPLLGSPQKKNLLYLLAHSILFAAPIPNNKQPLKKVLLIPENIFSILLTAHIYV